MAENTINTSFNYIFDTNKTTTLESDNYAIQYYETSDKVYGNFDKLSWHTSICPKSLSFAHVCFNNKYSPIDLVENSINKKQLDTIADKLNKQTVAIDNSKTTFNNLLNIENIFNVIGTLAKESSIYTDRENKYLELYDSSYARYIYRAKRTNEHKVETNKLSGNKLIPIFAFDCIRENPDVTPDVYLKIRNIEVPFKVIKTSSHNGIDSFIAIYNEVLLTLYQEYIDSVMFVEISNVTNIKDNKVYYDYLDSDILIPKINKTITNNNLANTRSNRSFFKKI